MNKILVPIDRTANARAAAGLAAKVAGAQGASITLYHGLSSLEHLMLSEALRKIYVHDRIAEWNGVLEVVREELRREQPGLEIDCVVEIAEPADGVSRQAAQTGAELIVIGAHDEAETSLSFGSVSTKVARDASIPVLVVRSEQSDRFPEAGLFRKPVVAVDYSKFSLPAVTLAAALSQPDEEIELVHVFFAPDFDEDLDLSSALTEARGRELERLSEFAARTDVAPIAVLSRVEGGQVAQQLLSFVASSEAELIVVGAHGRTGDVAILGTSTDLIIRSSTAPVLVIPEAAL